ncbi:hypothetical protein DLAC_11502 [Tieghemostelium lacteum]|uniref:Leucine-rich repeat-containing protein (LRR) n=1 Tax=Tieghemostelium lacteum TaxID=361077 RepID=A0A152A539_TIELA|nr:hypothetical protein DLAC_11502 [Tieghemostelium lacteum]|eukprot:KYR01356.1 hypothetical protein DLAC_11502 [Tieghemostelium lacteum]
MNNTNIFKNIIKFIFQDHYELTRGGLDNPRNKWIIKLVLISKEWFKLISIHFNHITIHNNSTISTLKTLLSLLDNKKSSEFSIISSINEIRFESLDRNQAKDREQYLFFIMNKLKQYTSLKSLLLIDSDICLQKIGSSNLLNTNIENIVFSSSAKKSVDLKLISDLLSNSQSLTSFYLYCEDGVTNHQYFYKSVLDNPSIQKIQEYQINFNEILTHQLSNSLIDTMIKSQNINKFKRLQLSGLNIGMSHINSLLNQLVTLESLNVPFNYIEYQSREQNQQVFIEFTKALSNHQTLKELFLYDNLLNLTDQDQISIKDLKSQFSNSKLTFQQLELFSIEQRESVLIDINFFSVRLSPKISVLKLSNGTINDGIMPVLSKYLDDYGSTLYFLSLSDNKLKDEKPLAVALSNKQCTIRELDISGNLFTGEYLIESLYNSDILLTLTLNSDNFTTKANEILQQYTSSKDKSLISFSNLKSNRINFNNLAF